MKLDEAVRTFGTRFNIDDEFVSTLNDLLDAARGDGFEDGVEEGYDNGWEAGREHGYDDGYIEGQQYQASHR